MAKIGSFDVVRKTVAAAGAETVEPDTFDFAGEQDIRIVSGQVCMLPIMEFANALYATDEVEEMKALAACYDMLRWCIEPEDWTRFRSAALRARAGLDDLYGVATAVWGAVGGPTSGPSASPDGPSTTGTSSKASSPAPTAPPSSTPAAAVDRSPSGPVLTGADWTPPPTMPGAGALVSIDEWVAARAA